ncbi:cellulose-binding protein [Streptomyces actinomycinicus]|uniref:Cellulose-binding protein n=1 Tax=Streptomyces actinomycinicus TaxID=1695166 RepID=A0A937JMA0_9ACTN|nr:cellulose-binding protein [Streptomyces actinomycinicus]
MTVRGRGYRPHQVDAYMEALSDSRDAAWERAARLTVLAKEMDAEAAHVREVLASLAPQTYEALGERARRVFQLVVDEAAALGARTRGAAREEVAQAEAYAEAVRREAQEAADALRAEADEYASQLLLAAQTEAEEIRVGARLDVKAERGEELASLRELRQRATGMLVEQAREHAARWEQAECEEAERTAELDARLAERLRRAEAELAEAERALEEAQGCEGYYQEEARVRADDIIAHARLREEEIARETEQVLREHGETWDDVSAHMDSVRDSLISLTGRAALE